MNDWIAYSSLKVGLVSNDFGFIIQNVLKIKIYHFFQQVFEEV